MGIPVGAAAASLRRNMFRVTLASVKRAGPPAVLDTMVSFDRARLEICEPDRNIKTKLREYREVAQKQAVIGRDFVVDEMFPRRHVLLSLCRTPCEFPKV